MREPTVILLDAGIAARFDANRYSMNGPKQLHSQEEAELPETCATARFPVGKMAATKSIYINICFIRFFLNIRN
jgi:hypothetical protein